MSVIRRARLDADLSQTALAARAGTSQSTLARYETGASLPTLPTLERLLVACGRSLELRVSSSKHGNRVSSVRSRTGSHADRSRRRRRRLLDAASRHGVTDLRIFGSIARGEATAESDVDLLVDLKPGRTLLDLVAFQRDAEEVLDPPVDAATSDMLEGHIRDEVLDQALPI